MIGIMSDSHDNLLKVREAVRLFRDEGCELVIHAGDFVAPFAVSEMGKLGCPVKAVFGNCDGERKGLKKAFQPFGRIRKAPFTFSHKNIEFLVTHLDSPIKDYLEQGSFDVLIFGHTHKPEIAKSHDTLLINPGETGGWLYGKSTVALLDPITLLAEIRAL